jgi:hypothetical protein
MTAPRITEEVRDAAEYVLYGHRYIPLEHPDMQAAHRTLQAAGVWSPAEVIDGQADAAKIEVMLVGVFCAGERHRVLYSILADGVEIGTAIHWTSKTHWPWGLTLPAGCIVNFGFRNKGDLVAAVRRFVKTGGIV